MEEFIIAISRTMGSFVILTIVTLLIGKHINSHKNYYSFALSITIGSFIANMGFDTSQNFTQMLASFLSLILLFYLFLILAFKSRRLRTWFSGQPTVVIESGKILDENMKKIKFSLDDLNQHLREWGVFDICEVDFALVEVSGELSIRKKNQFQPPTRQDLQLTYSSSSLPIELIMDGKIIEKNLNNRYTSDWIHTEIHKRNLEIEDIYYGVVNSNGSLFIDTYKDKICSPTDLE